MKTCLNPDLEAAPADLLTAYGLIEKALERVGPQNTDDKRCFGVGKGRGGPIDELRKVEEERGFQVVFAREFAFGLGGAQSKSASHEHREEGHADDVDPPPHTLASNL